jgi:hypothetical protein
MPVNPDNPKLSKYTVSFGASLALASVFNALLVVAKEKSPAVMAALQHLCGHHWISHAAIVVALFAAPGWLLGQGRGVPVNPARLVVITIGGTAISAAIIFGFYLAEIR